MKNKIKNKQMLALALVLIHPSSFEMSKVFGFRARSMKSLISKSQTLMSEDILPKNAFAMGDYKLDSSLSEAETKSESSESSAFHNLFSKLLKVYEPFNIKTLREGVARVQDKSIEQNLSDLLIQFGKLNDKRAAGILYAFAQSPVKQLRCVALENLGWLRVPETFSLMLEKVENMAENVQVRISSIMGLANYGGAAAARELTEQLKIEKNPEVKLALHQALDKLGGKPDFRFNLNNHEIKAAEDQQNPSVLVW